MTSLVLDASATVDLLLDNELGRSVRRHLSGRDLLSVAHLDAEVLSALGRLHRGGELSAADVHARLELLADLAVDRLPITGTLTLAAWGLRGSVALRDALYVASARSVGGVVLTTDAKLRTAAPGDTLDPSAPPRGW